jgi:ADP-heptose:LPS heptosyltransferase
MLDEARLVSGVKEFDRQRWKANRWSPATWREQILVYASLRKENFDWGLDLHGQTKTAIALRLARPKKRLMSQTYDLLSRSLNPVFADPPVTIHHIEHNHRALLTFDDFELPVRPIMPAASATDAQLVSISVGTGSAVKSWPAERWAEVGRAIVSMGFRVIFLGGPTDPAMAVDGAENMVGKLPLAETRDVVARSRLHLAADTGTGHMAAAYGVPVVSVFGPSNSVVFRPYTEKMKLLQGAATVDISVEQVLQAARGWLCES